MFSKANFHLCVVAVTPLRLLYLILFLPSARDDLDHLLLRGWGWGAPKSFLLAVKLQLPFFPSFKNLYFFSQAKCHDYENINLKIDIYTSCVNLWGQILAFWTPLTILEPSHLSIWKWHRGHENNQHFSMLIRAFVIYSCLIFDILYFFGTLRFLFYSLCLLFLSAQCRTRRNLFLEGISLSNHTNTYTRKFSKEY